MGKFKLCIHGFGPTLSYETERVYTPYLCLDPVPAKLCGLCQR